MFIAPQKKNRPPCTFPPHSPANTNEINEKKLITAITVSCLFISVIQTFAFISTIKLRRRKGVTESEGLARVGQKIDSS
jgi:hypothetical protein